MCCNLFNVDTGGGSNGGGAATPSLPLNSVQFNNAGSFGGNSNFLFDNGTEILTIPHAVTRSFQTEVTGITGDYSTVSTDAFLIVTTLAAAGVERIITISTSDIQTGRQISIKDGTGTCSKNNPIKIIVQNGALLDNKTEAFIDSPNGGIAFICDGTDFFSQPWNAALKETVPTFFSKDRDGTSALAEIPLLTLPLGTGSTNSITFFMTNSNGIPYVTSDAGGSTATLTFSHRLFNGSQQILTTNNGLPVTVTNGTNYYFTSDGLIDLIQGYTSAISFGELRATIKADAAGATSLYQIKIEFDSRGNFGGNMDIRIAGYYRSAEFLNN